MKEAAYILFISLIAVLFGGEITKKQINTVPQGTYVITADVIDRQGIVTNLIKADSIFVYGNRAIETKVKTLMLEINGVRQPRKDVFDGLYLIDLNQMSFCDLKSNTDFKSQKFNPLSAKKIGFDFYGEDAIFHHENFKMSKLTFHGMPAKKISYIISDGPYKNKSITIYTTDGKKRNEPLVLNPKMEDIFNGRIIEMQIDLNEQGTLIIKHLFTSHIKQEYMKYFLLR